MVFQYDKYKYDKSKESKYVVCFFEFNEKNLEKCSLMERDDNPYCYGKKEWVAGGRSAIREIVPIESIFSKIADKIPYSFSLFTEQDVNLKYLESLIACESETALCMITDQFPELFDEKLTAHLLADIGRKCAFTKFKAKLKEFEKKKTASSKKKKTANKKGLFDCDCEW